MSKAFNLVRYFDLLIYSIALPSTSKPVPVEVQDDPRPLVQATATPAPGADLGSNLEFLQITPNTVQVQFPGITGGNLMYVEERLYR